MAVGVLVRQIDRLITYSCPARDFDDTRRISEEGHDHPRETNGRLGLPRPNRHRREPAVAKLATSLRRSTAVVSRCSGVAAVGHGRMLALLMPGWTRGDAGQW